MLLQLCDRDVHCHRPDYEAPFCLSLFAPTNLLTPGSFPRQSGRICTADPQCQLKHSQRAKASEGEVGNLEFKWVVTAGKTRRSFDRDICQLGWGLLIPELIKEDSPFCLTQAITRL